VAAFAHLGAFVRGAGRERAHAVLAAAAVAALGRVEEGTCVWLSTSGLGVPWLHVRVDSDPKYYQHRPYRARPCV
jgi:hypothetical protein